MIRCAIAALGVAWFLSVGMAHADPDPSPPPDAPKCLTMNPDPWPHPQYLPCGWTWDGRWHQQP